MIKFKMDKFSLNESRVFAVFKKVRNRIRKYVPEEIIAACITQLNANTINTIDNLRQYPPWLLLLLIKWTLCYGDFLSPSRHHLLHEKFNSLVNLMHDLSGKVRLPSEYSNVFLFFRNIAFQQFWLQRDFNIACFARQSLLFDKQGKGHTFQQEFIQKVGFSISNFIELAVMLLTKFINEPKNPFVAEKWFESAKNSYPPDTIKNFLFALSLDQGALRKFLIESETELSSKAYEFYEQTPLKKYPLLKVNNGYYCFHRNLLFRAIETFIYDTLRNDNPEHFMEKFGEIFERYVERAIAYTGIPFLSEKELACQLPGKGKLVDFLIQSDEANIFIDAKGVEIAYLGMVGHRPDVIRDKTKSSVIKGIQQGFETAKRLSEMENNKSIKEQKQNYLLIVTFKDLFLGNGHDFYENIAKEKLDEIVNQYGCYQWIPFEHMYFLSIEDFDLFVQCVKAGKTGFIEGLKKAVNSDNNYSTKKFAFQLHILEWFPEVGPTEYLNKEYERIFSSCIGRLKHR
ncbi:MAG: hypothetical protein HYV59_10300 [Planctomycetes bacterium]|nr:hypothetical protein [Planctomycetota bacterium]